MLETINSHCSKKVVTLMSHSQQYLDILDRDVSEYRSCSFHWNCDDCTESFCVSLAGVAEFPTEYGHFTILGFANNKDKKDHIAVVKGDVSGKENVLTRLHSSCLTGDAMGSKRCDCGTQLRTALVMLEEAGSGGTSLHAAGGKGYRPREQD